MSKYRGFQGKENKEKYEQYLADVGSAKSRAEVLRSELALEEMREKRRKLEERDEKRKRDEEERRRDREERRRRSEENRQRIADRQAKMDAEKEARRKAQEAKDQAKQQKDEEKRRDQELAKELAKRGEVPGEFSNEYWEVRDRVAKLIKVYRCGGGDVRVFVRRIGEAQELEEVVKSDEIGRILEVVTGNAYPRQYWDEFYALHREGAKKPLKAKALLSTVIDPQNCREDQRLKKEPRPLSWSRREPCMKWFDSRKVREGEFDAWSEFLERLTPQAEDEFCAYIWSIFNFEDGGRQALWLHGQGSDGKSVVIDVIGSFLGQAYAAMSAGSHGNQFAYSAFLGKRLISYGDCQDPGIISYTKLHNILGGDNVPIERKGEQIFTAKIHARVIIGSNIAPAINDTINEKTRLIYIEVRPRRVVKEDTTWKDRLKAEFWSFLHYCRSVYERVVTDSGTIPHTLSGRVFSREHTFMEEFIKNNYEFDFEYPDDGVPRLALHELFIEKFDDQFSRKPTDKEMAALFRLVESYGGRDNGKIIRRMFVKTAESGLGNSNIRGTV